MNIIRTKRRALDLTQTELGEIIGYEKLSARSMVCAIEKGIKSIPKTKLLALSKTLDIPLEDLLKEGK